MIKFDSSSTPVVVFKAVISADHGALGIVRSLGRLGIPVYVVASDPQTSSFYSRYCRGKFVLDIDTAPEEKSLQFLLEVSKKIGGSPILIPTDDGSATFVADHADALRSSFQFQDQLPRLFNSLNSKKEMHFQAKKHGLPTPEAVFPQSRADVLNFLPGATFPIMLKAIYGAQLWGAAGQKMFIVRSEAELLDKYDQLEDPSNPNLMLQEYIPGGDDTIWMFDGYFNNESDCLFAITAKKIRQYPISRGSTSLGISLQNETVERATIEFMKKVRYKGIVDIDYRYDARDGVYKVLDINPRIGSSFRLFVSTSGMDAARALYADFTGQPVEPGRLQEGRKWFVEDQDLASSVDYYKSDRLKAGEWLSSFRGVEEAAYFALDDLWPCVMRGCKLIELAFGSASRLPTKNNSPNSENLSRQQKLRKQE
jgi:predicted ATP-grasp superfamily ATP-dependent carboligase